jgi:O-antigen/teichoic acid export membrane protein
MMPRLLNLSLRGGGMVGKFLLIFFLARILSPEEVGTYGLFTVTVGYALYFLGMDFYTYSGRAMLHAEQKMWPAMLRDQAVLFACSYMVVFPLLSLIFWGGMLPVKYALVFYVLLTMEHLSLECIRLLVIIGKPLAAGVFIFIRSGAWCYALVATYLGGLTSVELKTVFWLWVLADALAVAGGVWLLRNLPWGNLNSKINWAWIGQGLRVAALFLVGTLALRGIFTLDRYFVEAYSGREMLGVYTLYLGVCTSIIGFVDAAVFSFRYPRLVSIYKSGQYAAFESVRRDFGRQTLIAVTLLALAAAALIVPVLEWIGKPLYLQHLSVFYLLLAASTLFVIGHIPHYSLYAMGYDRSIVGAHIAGFIAFIVLSVLLAPAYGMGGVATALFMAVTLTGALKQWKFISLGKPGGPVAHGLSNRR